MIRFRLSWLKSLVIGAAAAGLVSVSCGGGNGGGFQRNKTMYLGGSQWGNPSTFNPLAEGWQAAWPVNDRFNLLYEPLIVYNSLNGEFEPLLGTLVSRDTSKIVVDLNPAARWSDGQPVTSADVKFIFELGRRFPSAATAYAIRFTSAIEVERNEDGGERLTFVVNKDPNVGRNNPLVVLDHLQAIRIVPSHVFEPLLAANNNDLGEVLKMKIDNDPVVSGPYNLHHYNNERIILKRRDDYWGNDVFYNGEAPAPEIIIHPIYKSNDQFANVLRRGGLDASQTFISNIWLMKKDQVSTWLDEAPYYLPGAMPILVINVTKPPLNDKNFRRAMAAAINYNNIREFAVSGYAPEVQPGLIMNQGLEEKYFSAEDAAKYGVGYDIELAKKILADAGYTSVNKVDGTLDHMLDKDGNRLPPLNIMLPSGWSDWEAMVKIAVRGLRLAGMDIRESPVDAGLYWPARPSGNFDIIMSKPADAVTPSLPWSRFDAVISSREWKPVGENMSDNYGRYNQPGTEEYNPRVDELLLTIPTLEDEAEQIEAYRELNRIFMQDQPAIPLVYMPEQFYQFSVKHWKGWPTAANPYAPPLLPWVGASTKILWNIELAKP